MENAMNKRSFLSGLFVCSLLISLVSATCHARDATSFDPRKIHVEAVNVGGGVPIGTIVAWPVATNPSDWEKWLECNGQAIDAAVYPELRALVGTAVPDLRGLFLRGIGGNSGALGVRQDDIIKTHTSSTIGTSDAGTFLKRGGPTILQQNHHNDGTPLTYSGNVTVQHTGGVETRPINQAVRYLIRAAR